MIEFRTLPQACLAQDIGLIGRVALLLSLLLLLAALSLNPRQARCPPASDLPAMPVGIEWPLETVGNIPALPEPYCAQCLGSHPATPARAADEKNLVVFSDSMPSQNRIEARGKLWVSLALRKILPLERDNPLANRRQVRKAHERPLGLGTHIHEHRLRITAEPVPNFGHGHIVDVDNSSPIHPHFPRNNPDTSPRPERHPTQVLLAKNSLPQPKARKGSKAEPFSKY